VQQTRTRNRAAARSKESIAFTPIFGYSDKCVATYPGDMANALYALDAVLRIRGANGTGKNRSRQEFHRLPGDAPEKDNNLAHGELIVAIEMPEK
jgi:xanthine dehydrogenase YagS FAD-binding subunit